MSLKAPQTPRRETPQRSKSVRSAGPDAAGTHQRPRFGLRLSSIFPWAIVLLAGLYLLSKARPPTTDGPMHIHEFGRLPVVERGRIKPADTLARNTLMIISDRQTFIDENGQRQPATRWLDRLRELVGLRRRANRQPAIRWLLDVLAGTEAAAEHKVFRVENDEVLDVLGLEPRPGFRYAVSEFSDRIEEFDEQAKRALEVQDFERNLYQRKVVELYQQLALFMRLSRMEIPHLVPPHSEDGEWKPFAPVEAEAQHTAILRLRAELARSDMDLENPSETQKQELVRQFHQEIERARREIHPAAQSLHTILTAYEDGDSTQFNIAVANYRRDVQQLLPEVMPKVDFEVFFNRFAPFYHCSALYVMAFFLACLAWLGWSQPLNQASRGLLVLTFVVHTFALGARMYLQGRPPVTNLYSSAIFIGWGCVILALVLEWIHRNGIGSVTAAVTGFVTLLIAHNLSGDGDTLEMMQAVLDTNLWLATHVTCVTTGYAATFMAGFLGILFVLRGVFTRSLDDEAVKTLGRMIYGVVCFAMFFSFTGTVLGGIWADQSWGRFWGWDPKENGALIIVLWNALILHARWGGLVQQRGMAVLAIFGNIVTSWSWFGVNMLGVGLHSYGFIGSAAFWLSAFVLSQLVLIGIGMLPTHIWRSFAVRDTTD